MKIFSKLIILIIAAFGVASCMNLLDDKNFSSQYTLGSTFEYGYEVPFVDSIYFEKDYGMGFSWRDVAYFHKLNSDKSKLVGGFLVSRLNGKGESDLDMYRVNSGVGYNGSKSYAVFTSNADSYEMPEHDMEFMSIAYGSCSMTECYVNNTKAVANAVRETFVPGDKLTVKMTGYLNGKATGSAEFVLAEKTESKDSLVTGWRKFNLEKLGTVQYVEIEMISTRELPARTFCIDNMEASIQLSY